RSDRRTPLALSRLSRLRNRVSVRRPLRPVDRGREGGDRAPAARRPRPPRVPLAELRPAPRSPARAGGGRGGATLLPSQRAAVARAAHRSDAPAARHTVRVGGAAATDA